jgi:hypothetical protein
VIATIQVLGLTPAGADAVVAAARRLVAYMQGTAQRENEPTAGLAGYFEPSATATPSPGVGGRARGSATGWSACPGRSTAGNWSGC